MTETAQTMTSVMAAAQGAVDEIGTGDAGAIACGCDLVRIGVFFDGTGNSRDHAGTGDVSWNTNVDALELAYRDTTGGPETMIIAGEERQVRFGRLYMRGIGVEAGGGTTTRGMAWGTGSEGVETRVNQAVDAANQLIRNRAQGLVPCQIWVDTFGFSRGAASARHFANQRGRLQGGNAEITVKFMGLFDTVSSIGSGGNTGNHGNVNIRTPSGTVENIVHLTADDEIRANFPLTRARAEARHRIIGAHSDVGGGYGPAQGDRSGDFNWRSRTYPGLEAWLRTNWSLVGETANAQGDRMTTTWWSITFEWTCEFGLQFVSLHLMYNLAARAGVPFDPLPTTLGGRSTAIPGDLQPYYNSLIGAGPRLSVAELTAIRIKYAHLSVKSHIVNAHVPTDNATRVEALM